MEEFSLEALPGHDEDFTRAFELPSLSKLRSRSSSREYLVPSAARKPARPYSLPSRRPLIGVSNRENVSDGESGLGVPGKKSPIDWIGLIAPMCSLVCLAISFVVVSQSSRVPWLLGYNNQLIVIGFVMGLEGLCLKQNALVFFTLLEARFGRSSLQNFDAILRSSATADHASLSWRIIILGLVFLPLGISVSYKQYPNGQATWPLSNHTQNYSYFGLTGPEGIVNPWSDDSISLMVNATIPFKYDSLHTSEFNHDLMPKAYGFNMLLLSDSATASLDAPMPEFVSRIQKDLGADGYHTWTMTADVYATVTRMNSSLNASTRSEDSFWEQYLDFGIYAQHIYNGYQVDFLSLNSESGDNSWCFIALAPSRRDYGNPLSISQGITDFVDEAVMFSTRREKCRGTWDITSTSIELVEGFCYDEDLEPYDQEILTNTFMALYNYYLPLLGESLGPYTLQLNGSSWTMSSMTSSISAMYWSRLVALNNTQDSNTSNYFRPFAASATRDVMQAAWSLYLVLSIFPAMAVFVYVGSYCLYSTPITRGFGLVSILAGAEHSSLETVQGSSLTGKMERAVTLKISVVEDHREGGPKARRARIAYTLLDNQDGGMMQDNSRHGSSREVDNGVGRSVVYH